MVRGAGSISVIGGTDGPTSIFIAGKDSKVRLATRIQSYFGKIKRNRMKRRITANPHTLEEVVEWLKREYGAVEVSQQSHNYLEQRKGLKTSLVMCHRAWKCRRERIWKLSKHSWGRCRNGTRKQGK